MFASKLVSCFNKPCALRTPLLQTWRRPGAPFCRERDYQAAGPAHPKELRAHPITGKQQAVLALCLTLSIGYRIS